MAEWCKCYFEMFVWGKFHIHFPVGGQMVPIPPPTPSVGLCLAKGTLPNHPICLPLYQSDFLNSFSGYLLHTSQIMMPVILIPCSQKSTAHAYLSLFENVYYNCDFGGILSTFHSQRSFLVFLAYCQWNAIQGSVSGTMFSSLVCK